jgi:hypothetical protein
MLKWLSGCTRMDAREMHLRFQMLLSVNNSRLFQWLHENGCPRDESACCAAAVVGHLEVLEWLHEHGCPWDNYTSGAASAGGRLEILQWLRLKRCPWSADSCEVWSCARTELALANGCPWDDQAIVLMKTNSNPVVQQCFRDNRSDMRIEDENVAAALSQIQLLFRAT